MSSTVEELRGKLLKAEQDLKYFKESITSQIKMDFDSRQELRDEKIKSFLDSQLIKEFFTARSQEILCQNCGEDSSDNVLKDAKVYS